MDTNEVNKIVGAVIGALLVFLLLGFFSDRIFHSDVPHGEGEPALAFALDTGEEEMAEAEGEAPPEEPAVDLVQLASAADPAAGEKVFNKCKACHKVEPGANAVGPHLHSVVGREIAAVDAYAYSDALGGKDGDWGVENLMAWLENPDEWAPGNKMGYALADAEERMDVIAWLNQQSDSPIDLVADAEASAPADAAAAESETEMAAAEDDAAAAADASTDEASDDASAAAAAEADATDAPADEAAAAEDGGTAPGATAEGAEEPAPAEDVAEAETGEPATETADASAPDEGQPSEGAAEPAETEDAGETAEATEPSEATEGGDAAETAEATEGEEPMEMAAATPAEEADAPAESAASPYAPLLAEASAEAGEKVFRRCIACHKVEEGQNGVGPHLYGVVGREIAGVGDYNYSDALAGKEGEWTLDKLMAWLEAPTDWAPGTKMNYRLRKEMDRVNVIVYLNELDGSPVALGE